MCIRDSCQTAHGTLGVRVAGDVDLAVEGIHNDHRRLRAQKSAGANPGDEDREKMAWHVCQVRWRLLL